MTLNKLIKEFILNQTDSQADYMNEIVIYSDEIQSLRNKGVYNALMKKLEEEKTSLILDYQKYKQFCFNETCEKILKEREKNDNKNFNP